MIVGQSFRQWQCWLSSAADSSWQSHKTPNTTAPFAPVHVSVIWIWVFESNQSLRTEMSHLWSVILGKYSNRWFLLSILSWNLGCRWVLSINCPRRRSSRLWPPILLWFTFNFQALFDRFTHNFYIISRAIPFVDITATVALELQQFK